MASARNTCRDFEKGICNRGDKCKYFHPEDVNPPEKLPICKDYQNKGCDRFKCKFLHISVEEQEVYHKTGKLPEHGGHPGQQSFNKSFGGQDICKDFLNGRCDRGGRCKFTHVSQRELDSGHTNGSQMYDGGMYGKRPRGDYDDGSSAFVEENEMLKRKITDLQRQVLELRQMNDTLYEQNTRYRNQLRGTATGEIRTDAYNNSQTAYTAQPVAAAVSAMDPTVLSGYNFAQY